MMLSTHHWYQSRIDPCLLHVVIEIPFSDPGDSFLWFLFLNRNRCLGNSVCIIPETGRKREKLCVSKTILQKFFFPFFCYTHREEYNFRKLRPQLSRRGSRTIGWFNPRAMLSMIDPDYGEGSRLVFLVPPSSPSKNADGVGFASGDFGETCYPIEILRRESQGSRKLLVCRIYARHNPRSDKIWQASGQTRKENRDVHGT